RKFFRLMILSFEFHLLEIEHNVGHVFDHTGKRGELVLCAGDFYRGNGSPFERRKQHAPERISNGVPVTGFKRLGGKFGVSVSGCALVFGESFWHFKTTVTNWHIF